MQHGAIDGSHISIKAPHINREDYFNRKQNYSINLQGVVDADAKFIDVSTGWPGSIHDARVLRLSTLSRRAENDVILTEPVRHINGVCVRLATLLTLCYLGLLALILIVET